MPALMPALAPQTFPFLLIPWTIGRPPCPTSSSTVGLLTADILIMSAETKMLDSLQTHGLSTALASTIQAPAE